MINAYNLNSMMENKSILSSPVSLFKSFGLIINPNVPFLLFVIPASLT